MRSRRRLLGLTQTQVAEACGVTFQQVQKYESGAIAFSVSRLVKIAEVLELRAGELVEAPMEGSVEAGQAAPPPG